MSRPFLTAGAATTAARSPMATQTAEAGASIAVRDGWEVAVAFAGTEAEAGACATAVGWADVSHLGKFEVEGAPGGEPPDAGVRWRCSITPDRSLLIAEPAACAALLAALEALPGVRAVDVTASYAAVCLVGPAARETIARFCALDVRPSALPVGGFRPGSIARTPGMIIREDDDRFLLLAGAAYGSYLWTVVADAGASLGGAPVGIDALAPLPSSPAEAAARA